MMKIDSQIFIDHSHKKRLTGKIATKTTCFCDDLLPENNELNTLWVMVLVSNLSCIEANLFKL